jgi:hypothetical protein
VARTADGSVPAAIEESDIVTTSHRKFRASLADIARAADEQDFHEHPTYRIWESFQSATFRRSYPKYSPVNVRSSAFARRREELASGPREGGTTNGSRANHAEHLL